MVTAAIRSREFSPWPEPANCQSGKGRRKEASSTLSTMTRVTLGTSVVSCFTNSWKKA